MKTLKHSEPLTPAVLHILLALSDGPKHGYAIMKSVEPGVKMGPGTLYGTIGRLLDSGWVIEAGEDPDDSRRRIYELTASGEASLTKELARLKKIVEHASARKLLGGQA